QMIKPTIFIGSSTEGLNVANAIHQNLDHFAEVTIWSQGIFKLSSPVITTLINSLNQFSFAIFVFSPDDITNLRGKNFTSVRDNVIFETGLFAGRLGIDRVFFLKPRGQNDLRLPTDLLGVIMGEYDPNRTDKNLVAATGPFCNQVKNQIDGLKSVDEEKKIALKFSNNSGESDTFKIENDLKLIEVYCERYNFTMVSFQKLKEMIHPKFTEEYIMALIEKYPLYLRRCKLREGVYGVELINRK
ncbi:nucleotide-binding protein, partial [Nostoc sp. CHAB 5834]|nr:nucleotide-binding protein [Nostoc sp. CHAB 5834]